jgi:hypothetical protein
MNTYNEIIWESRVERNDAFQVLDVLGCQCEVKCLYIG